MPWCVNSISPISENSGFFPCDKGEPHVFKRQPLQTADPALAAQKPAQRGLRRNDRMPRALEQRVTVARGAGGGIADPARAHDHRVRVDSLAGFQRHAPRRAVFHDQRPYARVQPHLHAQLLQPPRERAGDVAGFPALRETRGCRARLPWGSSSAASRSIIACGGKACSADYKKRGLRTTFCRNSSGVHRLVTLQRPLPVR